MFPGKYHQNGGFSIAMLVYQRVSQPTFSIEPRKKPSYFPLYWLVNRDPYNGLL